MVGEIANVREKAPDSDNGFASRGGFDYALDRDSDGYSSDVNAEREKLIDLEQYLSSVYGDSFEEDGTMDLDELIAKEMKRQRMGKREATAYARQLQKDYLDWRGRSDALADMMLYDGEGFASRGGRRSTAVYRDMVEDLPNLSRDRGGRHSPANPERARNATADRYALIHARRQIAREMAAANGVPFNKNTTIDEVSDDQDDIDLLEELGERIDQFNEFQTELDREYIDARHAEQTALKRVSEAQRRAKNAKNLREELGDETDEYGDEYRDYARSLLEDLEEDFGREGFDKGVPRSEGGGGYHENSDVTDEKLAQARRLLENGDPKDIPEALELMEEAAEIYAEKFNADYYKAEADGDELIDRGHRAVSIPRASEGSSGWDYADEKFDKEDGNSFDFIEDSLYGPSLEEAKAAADDRRNRYRTWASTSGPVAPPRYGDPYGGKYPNELTDSERDALKKLRASDGDGFASRGGPDLPLGLTRDDLVQYLWQGDPNENWEEAEAIADNWMNSKNVWGKYIGTAKANRRNDSFPAANDRTRTIRSLLEAARMAYSDRRRKGEGFASRGSRRRPGRRNQGKKRQGMAPKTRYSEEDRQNIADGNVLRSRKRPGKRRGGPDASEWDGFASAMNTERDSDMPVSPTMVFEGGEHGPGKDVSLNKMWDNYREKLERVAASSGKRNWNAWVSETPLYRNVEVEDGNGGFTLEEEVLFYPATIDDFMKRFGPDSRVGLDEESVRRLFDSRRKGSPEFFIDDPYLAERLATELGYETGQRAGLFGFDPMAYFDDTGNRVDLMDDNEDAILNAAVDAERARRTARLAARAGRAGKRDIIQRRRDAVEPSRPVGEMSLREFEDKLFANTGVRVRFTDDNGNALSSGAMARNVEASGLNFFNAKGTRWSAERYRQMQKAGYLPDSYARELVNQKLLKEGDLAGRDAMSAGEFSQWPGFRGLGGGAAGQIRNALIEMGIELPGSGSNRTIEEGIGRAGRGVRERIRTGRLGGKGSVLVSMAKVREMVERLGLDADEFEKWFRRTDNFTDRAPSAPTE